MTLQIPNGVLTEFTLKLGGSREFFDRELKLDRTITTSITGIGTTRLDVPDDAKEIVDALIAGRRNEVFVPEPGFRKLFDGRTLAGWEGQPGFWSVQGRAITGRTTKENPLKRNTFLFARPGGKDLIVDDFELRLPAASPPTTTGALPTRASSTAARTGANSSRPAIRRISRLARGTRASSMTKPAAPAGAGSWPSGQAVTWNSAGRKEVTGSLGSSAEIQAKIKKNEWNDYVVIARGSHLQHFINGMQTVDVYDEVESKHSNRASSRCSFMRASR